MATKRYKVKLSPIAKEIDKATKQLKAIRSKLSPKERKKLNLEIKALHKAKALVAEYCRIMTSFFPG
jgi:Skp family chaperone for outer membrane proteins